jgi:2,3,4,5-tetrahydropyridine-2,6-dicarboxylate N-succinyltransferase
MSERIVGAIRAACCRIRLEKIMMEFSRNAFAARSTHLMNKGATGVGIATLDREGALLDCWFPKPELGGTSSAERHFCSEGETVAALGEAAAGAVGHDPLRDVRRVAVRVSTPDLCGDLTDLYDVYLRLHLLSHRLARPHMINLTNLLKFLRYDVAWTSHGPCAVRDLGPAMARARWAGRPFVVRGSFPVPPMLDYVWPEGVNIADSIRVLLGAYLAPGTMVTPVGFCGLNAGTLGPCMVEGRVSTGVVIGEGCHVGAGASLMGVISGGGRELVSLGARCLLGANSGAGIPLGDDCVIEAGCYVTAGSLVRCADGRVVKAAELANRPNLLFRRHSQTGALEAIENSCQWSGLHPDLHEVDEALGQPHAEDGLTA